MSTNVNAVVYELNYRYKCDSFDIFYSKTCWEKFMILYGSSSVSPFFNMVIDVVQLF